MGVLCVRAGALLVGAARGRQRPVDRHEDLAVRIVAHEEPRWDKRTSDGDAHDVYSTASGQGNGGRFGAGGAVIEIQSNHSSVCCNIVAAQKGQYFLGCSEPAGDRRATAGHLFTGEATIVGPCDSTVRQRDDRTMNRYRGVDAIAVTECKRRASC